MAQKAPELTNAEGLREVRSLDLVALRPTIRRVCGMAAALSGAQHAYVVLNEDGQIWHSAFAGFEDSLVDEDELVASAREVLRANWTLLDGVDRLNGRDA